MDNVITRSPWAQTAPIVDGVVMHLPVLNQYPDNMARFIAPIDRRELFDGQGNKASHVGLFDDAQCVGTVSPSYKVIQNRVAHDMMESSIREGGYEGNLDIIPTQGGRSGGRWSVRYVLKDLCFNIRQRGKQLDTKVSLEILLRNSYDNSTGTSVAVSMFDHFCDNGMIFNSLAEVFKAKHTRHAEDTMFRVSPDQIATAMVEAQQQADIIRMWAETDITAKRARELLKDLKAVKEHVKEDKRPPVFQTPRNELELLMSQFEQESEDRGQTLWSLVSAVTAWSTPRNTAEAMPSVRRRQNTDPLALGEGRQDRAVVWIANLQNMARAA